MAERRAWQSRLPRKLRTRPRWQAEVLWALPGGGGAPRISRGFRQFACVRDRSPEKIR